VILEKELTDKLDQIQISKRSGSVDVDNPTGYKLLGKGHQGAVFKIDDNRCVKIYCRSQDLERELHCLKLGAKVGICPQVFFSGDNFIVMEYMNCPTVLEYLENNPINKELTVKLIELLDLFEKAGYNRFDHSLRHIYLVPDDKLRIIDVVHMIKSQPVNLADKIISEMGANTEDFIQFVQEISPKWYNRWKNDANFPDLIAKVKGTV
jgi:predicted Ser/Thr protein kinase